MRNILNEVTIPSPIADPTVIPAIDLRASFLLVCQYEYAAAKPRSEKKIAAKSFVILIRIVITVIFKMLDFLRMSHIHASVRNDVSISPKVLLE